MPLREGTKKIANNPPWASAPTADRTDPDDATLTPPLVIANGWQASFSADAGDTPRRRVMNEINWRDTSAIKDIINYGILPWDADVDTLLGGVKQLSGVAYRALANNGPTYGNAISPTTAGQTVWEIISGTTVLPGAPNAPQATSPTSGELDWFWNCPLDGGSIITEFDFQWRVAGNLTWSPGITVATPRYAQTGLTNGQTIQARVIARTSQGDSPPSATGTATPSGTVPGGGATLALRADAGDARADLTWLEPDDGGVNITSYTVQWRTSGQAFSTGRQSTATNTEATITGLVNGTEYFFRVRAVNGEGNGAWSNQASATPMAVVAPPMPPADTVPDAPTGLAGVSRPPLLIDWAWDLVVDDGGQTVESYDHQWRVQGVGWTGNVTTVTGTCLTTTAPNANNGIQARVRARNSVGVSASWSATATVSAGDIQPTPTQIHRFTSSQTWLWPYDSLERAVALLVGRGDTETDAPKNIDLGMNGWNGAVFDGITLWFVRNTSAGGDAFAYTAATRARDSAKDIDLGTGGWDGAVSDGITLWFINDSSNTAVARVAATQARDSAKDISLGAGDWNGAVSDGATLWFVDADTDTAAAYVAATRARDSAKDIDLGTGFWNGAVSDGATLWFVNHSADTAAAYTAATRARDSAKDIDLGAGSWSGAVSDGATLWFVGSGDTAVAYVPPVSTQIVTGGSTYTTVGDADGVVTQAISNIADNAAFAITLSGAGYVEIYPQAG